MEFGVRGLQVKGNGAKSKSSETSELEDSLKMLERKQSRVLPPVPVRNVNGAKANVKESDYAHIEDLKVHGHTPKLKRKTSLLKPYAQVSMRDPPAGVKTGVATETTSDPPPPIPARPAGSGRDGEGDERSHRVNLKVGQSIRDLPLPPRPDEIEGVRNLTPSPLLPPPPGHQTYDSLPRHDGTSGRESWCLYDVPRTLLRGENYNTYDTPRSALHQPHPLSEDDMLPRKPDGSRDQFASLPRQLDNSRDLYDVPRSVLGSAYDIYDVPRTLTREAGKKLFSIRWNLSLYEDTPEMRTPL